MMDIYHHFKGKIIEFTDGKWLSLTPISIPRNKWDVLYVREKIVK
jgi:hypothetical protein